MTDKTSQPKSDKKPKALEDLSQEELFKYQKLAAASGMPASRNRTGKRGRPQQVKVKSIPKKAWAPVASIPLMNILGLSFNPSDYVIEDSRVVTPLKPSQVSKISKPKVPRKVVLNPRLKSVQLIKTRTRARTQDAFKSPPDLMVLRTKTWFSFLLASTIPAETASATLAISIDNFIRYLDNSESPEPIPDLKRSFENWLITENLDVTGIHHMRGMPHHFYERPYETGKATPTVSTLRLFEGYVPGSKFVYEEGLFNLPVWAVLSGDKEQCRIYVDSTLSEGGLFGSQEAQFEALIEALIPYYALPDSKFLKNYIQSICTGDPITHSYIHPAIEGRIESIYAAVENAPENCVPVCDEDDDEPYFMSYGRDTYTNDQIVDLPEMVLAAFAMLKFCSDKKSGPMLQLEWLVMGLCCGLYSDLFTADIQEYILQDVRKNGDLLTKHFESMGLSIVPFDQRWKSYGLI